MSNLGCGVSAAAAFILAVVLGVFAWHMEYGTERTVTFTVRSLDDQSQGSSGHKYLIFTSSDQVYENTDAWFHGKTDSSNIQTWLTPGDTYRCPVYGWRFTLTSSYPDILDGCKQVTR